MKRSKRWLWFYLVVLFLAIAAPTVLYFFNRGQMLMPEVLAANRKLWKEKGPRSYNLTYSMTRGVGVEPDYYVVVVKDGKTTAASVNGRPEEDAERLTYYGMDRLFDDVERFMKHDSDPKGPRVLHRAQFDRSDGHLLFFLRSVRSTGQRQVIEVESVQAQSPTR